MAKRGRPRKTGERYPNGKLKRPTLAQLQEADAAKRRENMNFVASQPHRRELPDPFSDKAASALGRFWMVNRLRNELYEAGHHYAEITRRWRSANCVPDPLHQSALGCGQGPSEASVASWWREIERIEAALRRASVVHYAAARHLCIDDADLPDTAKVHGIEALKIIAAETGRSVGEHPFKTAA